MELKWRKKCTFTLSHRTNDTVGNMLGPCPRAVLKNKTVYCGKRNVSNTPHEHSTIIWFWSPWWVYPLRGGRASETSSGGWSYAGSYCPLITTVPCNIWNHVPPLWRSHNCRGRDTLALVMLRPRASAPLSYQNNGSPSRSPSGLTRVDKQSFLPILVKLHAWVQLVYLFVMNLCRFYVMLVMPKGGLSK